MIRHNFFRRGQDALKHEAIWMKPSATSAGAGGWIRSWRGVWNLGVVYMRRKQWTKALDMLRQGGTLS